jgi:hypothetical protein
MPLFRTLSLIHAFCDVASTLLQAENAFYYPEAEDMVEMKQFNQLGRSRSVAVHPDEQVVVRHL